MPGEKAGVKEPELWQMHHTHHTALGQGGCVHALTSSTQDPAPCPAPELLTLPHPTPAGQPPPWAPRSCTAPPASKPPLPGAENDKYRPGEESSRLRRARTWSLRVPLPLPGSLFLLQDPYKGEAKSTLRLALKKRTRKRSIFPRPDDDFSPTARESTLPRPPSAPPTSGQLCLLFLILNKQITGRSRSPGSWQLGGCLTGTGWGRPGARGARNRRSGVGGDPRRLRAGAVALPPPGSAPAGTPAPAIVAPRRLPCCGGSPRPRLPPPRATCSPGAGALRRACVLPVLPAGSPPAPAPGLRALQRSGGRKGRRDPPGRESPRPRACAARGQASPRETIAGAARAGAEAISRGPGALHGDARPDLPGRRTGRTGAAAAPASAPAAAPSSPNPGGRRGGPAAATALRPSLPPHFSLHLPSSIPRPSRSSPPPLPPPSTLYLPLLASPLAPSPLPCSPLPSDPALPPVRPRRKRAGGRRVLLGKP